MAKKRIKKLVKPFSSQEAEEQVAELLNKVVVSKGREMFSTLSSGTRQQMIDKLLESITTAEAYTKTYVDTGLSVVGRERIADTAKDLGLTWFRYIGGVIKTSRDFCIERDGGYYHEEEIEEWASEDWSGKIEGTTEENIFALCGGWNCRHDLIPVHISSVPEEDLQRYLNEIPDEDKLEELPAATPQMPQEELDELYYQADEVLDIEQSGRSEEVLRKLGITEQDANVITKYTTQFHTQVNALENNSLVDLRNPASLSKESYTDAVRKFNTHLEQSLMKLPGTTDKELYRVEVFSEDRWRKYTSGEPVSISSFLSTSNSKTSDYFMAPFDEIKPFNSRNELVRTRIVIQPKAGSAAKNIIELSDVAGEREVLFNRNSSFILDKYDKENYIVYLKEL
jgi:hypothetical protein